MTDPFAVELRRHFVETADEVAQPEQLGSLQRAVAATPQQAPWYVRLRWVVSPWAPYANAGVRAALLATAVLLLLVALFGLVVVGGGGQPLRSTPFEGRWTSVDPVDGSAQILIVGPGEKPAVHYEDADGMHCRLNADSSFHFTSDGVGEVDGSRMVSRHATGGCVSWQVEPYVRTYQHDSLSDTMLDSEGGIWEPEERPTSTP